MWLNFKNVMFSKRRYGRVYIIWFLWKGILEKVNLSYIDRK